MLTQDKWFVLESWLSESGLVIWLAIQSVLILVLLVMVWRRDGRGAEEAALTDALDHLLEGQARLEQAWRGELAQSQTQLREELSRTQMSLRQELAQAHEAFRSRMGEDAARARQENAQGLEQLAASFTNRLSVLTQASEGRLQDLRDVVEKRLQEIRTDNQTRLEAMRQTVDEKLQTTLEQRLSDSFRQVSERLEAVHQGLGEMQNLAQGVGDLKRVLTNVKTRGTWGEVQMMRLVEDLLTPSQYALNVRTVPGSSAMVELAIRLPGNDDKDTPVWLPVDAKFPREEYERLQQATEAGDEAARQSAITGLRRALEVQAKAIASRYLAPPHTTDFAIMFLPSEGLYAQVLSLPGIIDRLQAMRIMVAGPVNFAAMLNSLQMGFRTLAIEQRSSEVWQILRTVKTEFDKFGDALARMRRSLETAGNSLGETERRTRVMLGALKDIELLEETPQGEDESSSTQDAEI